jgi:hypothetical protein
MATRVIARWFESIEARPVGKQLLSGIGSVQPFLYAGSSNSDFLWLSSPSTKSKQCR